MIESFLIANIIGHMQQARLLEGTRRNRIKEEQAFYDSAGSSLPVRLAAWLTQPADEVTGRTRVRSGKDECGCQAACLTRP
ncbi:hypothetical protein FHX15_001509 [Rhizobium sp. BK650]|nr:hypothetical protein [Rhizobium sp. BK650]